MDLKKSAFLINLLLRRDANSIGKGMRRSSVPTIYLKLFHRAFKNIESVKSLE
jgi:hypothetical protein